MNLYQFKTHSSRAVRRTAVCLKVTLHLFGGVAFLWTSTVQANPVGEQVVAGAAGFERVGGALTITQGTDRAVINWNSFSIGAGEITKFVQPSSSSAVLNRVITANNPSAIYGTLQANGQVYLINPAGIFIGPGGLVDTASFVASTHDVGDKEFMGGGDLNFTGSSGASIINQGRIEARQGDVFLVARQVSNEGQIMASDGTVGMISGTEVCLHSIGPNNYKVRLIDVANDTGVKKTDNGIADVVNAGVIEAANAELESTGNYLSLAIKNTGVIRATGVVPNADGTVTLTGGEGDILNTGVVAAIQKNIQGETVGGRILASAKNITTDPGSIMTAAGTEKGGEIGLAAKDTVYASGKVEAGSTAGKGGKVQVTGERVALIQAELDVSGKTGGGTVLVGGDYLGKNPDVPNAKAVVMTSDSVIRANATENGDGGKVILWSDEYTGFYGEIFARGGIESGNGGFVETSSKDNLQAFGTVIASAVNGQGGLWLLDPTDVEITAGTNANPAVFVNPWVPTGSNSKISAASIKGVLDGAGTTSVTIQTSGNFAQPGNITMTSGISKGGGGAATLTMIAAGSINISQVINSTVGTLTLILGADQSVTIGANITTNGGNLIIQGAGTTANPGSALATSTTRVTFEGGTITTGAGNLSAVATGLITQSGGFLSIGGTSTFTTGGAAISLTQANNDFGGAVNLINTGGNAVTVTDANAIVLGTSSVGSGTLTVIANAGSSPSAAGISQSGGGITQSGAGAVTFDAGNGVITLTQANNFSGAVSLNNKGNFAVAVKDINDMVLGTSLVGETGTGNLTVTVGGALTQLGVLTVTGTTTLIATVASTDINISSQANVLTGAVSIGGTASNVRDFKLQNTSATAGTVGNLGNLITETTNLRDLTIIYENAAYEIPALTMTSLRNIVITAGGEITQSGEIIQGVAGATASFTKLGTGDFFIVLENPLNNFLGAVSFTSDYDVGVTDADALILGASTIGGNFYITTGAEPVIAPAIATGGLTQTGILTVGGTTELFSLAAETDIDLSTQRNVLRGQVLIDAGTASNVRDFKLQNTSATDATSGRVVNLGDLTSNLRDLTIIYENAPYEVPAFTTVGNIVITAGGAITQAAGGIVQGSSATTASFTTGAFGITLTDTSNNFIGAVSLNNSGANNVAVTDINAITLGTSLVGTGTLTVNAGTPIAPLIDNNSIKQSGGGITQAASAGTATFNAGAGAITLTQANNFTGAVSLNNTGNNAVAVTDANAIILGSSSVGWGTLTVTAVGITQATRTTITQAASESPEEDPGAVTFNGGAGVITLVGAGNNDFTGTVSLNNSGANDVALTDINGLTLGASIFGGAFTATSITGSTGLGAISVAGAILRSGGSGTTTLTLDANSSITVEAGGSISGSSGGNPLNVILNAGAGVTLNGPISSMGGGITINSQGSGEITLGLAGSLNTGATGRTDGSNSGNVIINQSGTGSITLNGSISTSATSTASTTSTTSGNGGNAGSVTITTAAGAITVGSITAVGARGASPAAANATFSGGAGGAITITAGNSNITIVGGQGEQTPPLFTFDTTGGLVGTGSGLGTGTAGAGGTVTFNSPVLLTTGSVSITTGATAGDILFNSTLDGALALELTSGTGSITFSGLVGNTTPLGAVRLNAASTVTASAVTGTDSAAFSAASLIQAVASTGLTSFQSITTTPVVRGAGGDVILRSSLSGGPAVTVAGLIDTRGNNTGGVGQAGGSVTITTSGTSGTMSIGSINTSGGTALVSGAGGAGGNIALTATGSIAFGEINTSGGGALTSGAGGNAGDISLDTLSDITISGDLTASGGNGLGAVGGDGADLEFFDPVVLGGASTINTSGGTGSTAGASGNVTFNNTLNGSGALTITISTVPTLGINNGGNITFREAVGETTPLGAVTIDNSAALGTVQFGSGLAPSEKGFRAASLNLTTFALTLLDNLTIDTTGIAATGGSITVNGAVNGALLPAGSKSLTLNAGTLGEIIFGSTIGATRALSALTITQSGGARFSESVTTGTVTILDGALDSTVAFEGDLTATTGMSVDAGTAAYNVSITGANNTIGGATTFNNLGALTIGRTLGTTTFTGGLEAIAQTGATDGVTLLGTVATGNTTMTLGDADTGVTLGADTVLNSGTGAINVNGALAGGGFDLKLQGGAGTGTVTIAGAISNLGSLTTTANAYDILITGGGTIGDTTTFLNTGKLTIGTGGLTPTTTTFTGGLRATAQTGAVDGVTLLGTVATTGTGTMTLGEANTGVTLGADTVLNSGTGAISVNGALAGGGFGLTLQGGLGTGTVTIARAISNLGSLTTTAAGYDVLVTGGGTIGGATTFLNTGKLTIGTGGLTPTTTTFTGGLTATAQTGAVDGVTLLGTVATGDTIMTLGDAGTGVTLGAATTLKSGTGVINFDGALTGGAFGLSLQDATAGSTGAVNITGGIVSLASLTTFGGLSSYAVSITGAENTIAGATTFNNRGALTIGRTLGTSTFTGGLRATAQTGAVDGVTLLGTVATTGTGTMTLGEANTGVTLGADTVLNSGTGAISVNGALAGGGFGLTLQGGLGTGTVTIARAISNLGSLTTTAAGYDVLVTGGGTIGGATTFLNTGKLTIGTGGLTPTTTTFTGGLTATAQTGAVDGVTLLGTVATTGAGTMTLGDANTGVTLGANTVLNSGTGAINVNGALSAATVQMNSAGDISAINSGNRFLGPVTIGSSQNTALYLNESDNANLGSVVANQNFTLVSNDALTLNGVRGSGSLSGEQISGFSVGRLILNTGSILIPVAFNYSNIQNLSLITSSGGINGDGVLTVPNLTLQSSGQTSLLGGNKINNIESIVTGAGLELVNSQNLSLNGTVQ